MWVNKDIYFKLSVCVSNCSVFNKKCKIANGLGECGGLTLTSNKALSQLLTHFPTPSRLWAENYKKSKKTHSSRF